MSLSYIVQMGSSFIIYFKCNIYVFLKQMKEMFEQKMDIANSSQDEDT